MNPKSLANLTANRFKPGQSGCPGGQAGILPPEIRAERKRNQSALIALVTKTFSLTTADIESRIVDGETNQLERAVIAMVAKCREGHVDTFKYLMDLMIGRIPTMDYDSFTEDDLRILNRVKEVIEQRRQP